MEFEKVKLKENLELKIRKFTQFCDLPENKNFKLNDLNKNNELNQVIENFFNFMDQAKNFEVIEIKINRELKQGLSSNNTGYILFRKTMLILYAIEKGLSLIEIIKNFQNSHDNAKNLVEAIKLFEGF